MEISHHKVLSFMNIWKRILRPYDTETFDITITDTLTGENISVSDLVNHLNNKIEQLQNEINILKEENIENTNLIYELSHNIDAIDARIDIIAAQQFTRNKNV